MQITIQAFIEQSTDILQQIPAQCGNQIETASSAMVGCLLNEGKIISCGNGNSAICAQSFSLKLLNHFIQERPSLPAIALGADNTTLTAIANDYGYSEIYSKQIRALGNNKDILLAITYDDNSVNILNAIQAAHDRDMLVIALTASQCEQVQSMLLPDDIEICVTTDKLIYLQHAHLLIIDCLCNLIDHQLFGSD